MLDSEQIKRGSAFAIGFGSIVLGFLLLIYASHIFLMLFTAILFAIFLNGSADFLCRKAKIPYGLAIALVLILITIVVVVLGILTGPQIGNQFDTFVSKLPNFFQEVRHWIEQTPLGDYLLPQNSAGAESNGSGGGVSLLKGITGIFSSVSNLVASGVVILIIGIYAATGYERYTRSLLYLAPKDKHDKLSEIGRAIVHALRWWLVGRVTMMFVVGILTGIGLWILGVPLALFLAFIAFLFAFVPFIGPIASAIPAVILASSQNITTGFYVVALYILVQSLESYLITPWIQDQTVSIPPALLILGQILMGFLAGVVGVLMATPLILVIIILVQILYVKDVLGYDITLMGNNKRRFLKKGGDS